MNLKFQNINGLEDGITSLQSILGFEISDDANITVTAKKSDDDGVLRTSLNNGQAIIEYNHKVSFFRGLMLLCQNGEKDFEICEKRKFNTNGAMFDVSRNAVMRVETVKEIMARMALMGLDTFMLYTEDTYEVEGHEYFGHMRGRYTKKEIKDMESYAETFGIELIPCIQLLGHLPTALAWPEYKSIRDTNDTLRADCGETYKFIDDILRSVSETFKTRRIHIGMDESNFLGRGRWLDHNSYEDQNIIFYRHLGKCLEIAKKYGFKPMMWSDGFFDVDGKHGYRDSIIFTEEMKNKIPRGVDHVYWEYNIGDEETYTKLIKLHREISDKVIFAGGIWTWMSPCPSYGKTINKTLPALNACIKNGVKDVFATIWHNGAECPLVTSLLGIMLFAEMDYTGVYDLDTIKKRFEFICGVNADDILLLDKADHPDGGDISRNANPTRFLMYNDPLAGLCDYHVSDVDFSSVYQELSDYYEKVSKKDGLFKEAFSYYSALFRALDKKAEYGVRLKSAYDNKDFASLQKLYEESFEIQENIRNLRSAHRKSWLYYNKAFGFEVFDMIYGAMESRFETVRYHLEKLKEDSNYVIEELKEKRLALKPPYEGCPKIPSMNQRFARLYSANVMYTVYCDENVG